MTRMTAEAAKTIALHPARALRAGLARLRRWVRLLLALRLAALALQAPRE